MKLKALLEGLEIKKATFSLDMEVPGVAYDSRKVSKGDVFVAIKGEIFDGRDFIGDALGRGASAVVVEGDYPPEDIPLITVHDGRAALACISANFYGRPSERLKMIGVTGTNGKTTTTYLIKSILEVEGGKVGLIGTINYMIGDKLFPAPHTTPEALEYQRLLSEMLEAGCAYAVSEVSSHALTQRRADCSMFDAAVFTNLTREHLDFHKDMESYYLAKKRLFTELLSKKGSAVINADDPYGGRLLSALETGGRFSGLLLSYGIESRAALRAVNIEVSYNGLSFDMEHEGKSLGIKSALVGIPNVYNILSASGAAISMGISPEAIEEGIKNLSIVRGRFEAVEAGQDFLVVVDYAHTPDALERLIDTAKILRAGYRGGCERIITVFGCGGDRDRGKRPEMGAIATSLSDFVIITDDNPRGEDPLSIIKDIEAGIRESNFISVPDRKEAIWEAVAMASSGDIVLIAGKGHEDYQEIKGIRHPFSDRLEAERAVRKKLGIKAGG
jgi:UDP-N-acetylmuramoyl-L-alanyl-D-glutamate--2,6-diaminopimelate ligase